MTHIWEFCEHWHEQEWWGRYRWWVGVGGKHNLCLLSSYPFWFYWDSSLPCLQPWIKMNKNEAQVTSSGHGVWCAQCTPHQWPPHKKDEWNSNPGMNSSNSHFLHIYPHKKCFWHCNMRQEQYAVPRGWIYHNQNPDMYLTKNQPYCCDWWSIY